MTEPTELLLCPFCGGNARKVKHSAGVPGSTGYDRWHGVACAGCNACVGARDRRFRTSAAAIAVWNTRTPQPTQAVPPAGREQITADDLAKRANVGAIHTDRNDNVVLRRHSYREQMEGRFERGWREAEKYHGIKGKEAGNA